MRLQTYLVLFVMVVSTLAIVSSFDHAYATNMNPTNMTITANSAIVHAGDKVVFTIQVNDMSFLPTTPKGTVAFTDNNAGGEFNPMSCLLYYGNCTTTYTTNIDPKSQIKIFAGYSGDDTHVSSSITTQISTNVADPTILTITPGSKYFKASEPISVSAIVTDTVNPTSSLIGFVSWNDNNAGGSFVPNQCLLVNDKCTLTYYPPVNPTNGITINANYGGDSKHVSSTGSTLVMNDGTSVSPTIMNSTNVMENCINSGKYWNATTNTCSEMAPIVTTSPVVKQSTAVNDTVSGTGAGSGGDAAGDPMIQPNVAQPAPEVVQKPVNSQSGSILNTIFEWFGSLFKKN